MKNLLAAIKKSFDQVKSNGLLYLMTNLFFQLVRSVLLLPFFSLIFKGVLKSAHIFAVTNQTFFAGTRICKKILELLDRL